MSKCLWSYHGIQSRYNKLVWKKGKKNVCLVHWWWKLLLVDYVSCKSSCSLTVNCGFCFHSKHSPHSLAVSRGDSHYITWTSLLQQISRRTTQHSTSRQRSSEFNLLGRLPSWKAHFISFFRTWTTCSNVHCHSQIKIIMSVLSWQVFFAMSLMVIFFLLILDSQHGKCNDLLASEIGWQGFFWSYDS